MQKFYGTAAQATTTKTGNNPNVQQWGFGQINYVYPHNKVI